MTENYDIISPYRLLADKCGTSEVTLRRALARQPVTWQTAWRLANRLGIPVNGFRIKEDRRGRRSGAVVK